ncbi:MAG TPA: glycoside hydrolase family 13 protein [Mycobacteriales bacterium]|nr:glycoside hydrolase family 13 protein [Mycobacteriales bacterium]
MERAWWRDAVFYEVYIRSFADSDGDGAGDLPGVRSRLPYLRDLGVDAIWLTPFYPSPMVDGGYDVADHRGVDPLFGTLRDVDALLAEAHALGLRVTVDVVPNHTSAQHPWFREAIRAKPDSPARRRFLFRRGKGRRGERPPNNWESVFGGPAWTRVPDGEWYLHLFDAQQPDLNWRNRGVVEEFDAILRFWLDRGVDGFRVDVAHGVLKHPELPDNPAIAHHGLLERGATVTYEWDQPEVHDVYRRWRAILDSYPGDRMAVGEAWVSDPEALARYVRPDELHQAFNFDFLKAPWDASRLRGAIDRSLATTAGVGATTTWVLSNHDVTRHLTRYGGGARGEARARAAVLLMLALPGSVYLYQGEELGLPEVHLPDEVLQDPVWERSGHTNRGRDGCRVPMPWTEEPPAYGFTTAPHPWLPPPEGWGRRSVAAQSRDPESMLRLYRAALSLRRELPALTEGPLRWLGAPPRVLAFRRDPDVTCMVNCGPRPVRLPPCGDLVLASRPLTDAVLPPDAAGWWRETGRN